MHPAGWGLNVFKIAGGKKRGWYLRIWWDFFIAGAVEGGTGLGMVEMKAVALEILIVR